jgi:hypothetical protein
VAASAGSASKPVPTTATANTETAASPANGRRAAAASCSEAIGTPPRACRVAAAVIVAKNVMALDAAEPMTMSSVDGWSAGRQRPRAAQSFSSASCPACQKRK